MRLSATPACRNTTGAREASSAPAITPARRALPLATTNSFCIGILSETERQTGGEPAWAAGSVRDSKRRDQPWKEPLQLALAERRHHRLARRAVAAQPLAPHQMIGQCRPQRPAEVRPALAPVEAAAREVAPLALGRRHVEAEPLQEGAALGAEAEIALIAPEEAALQQRVRQRDAEP